MVGYYKNQTILALPFLGKRFVMYFFAPSQNGYIFYEFIIGIEINYKMIISQLKCWFMNIHILRLRNCSPNDENKYLDSSYISLVIKYLTHANIWNFRIKGFVIYILI